MAGALNRALDLIEILADEPEGVGVVELGIRLNAPTSSVHRLLAALVDRGFVGQSYTSKRYALGPTMLRIASSHPGSDSLLAVAMPHIERLRSRTTESVFLSRLIGDDVVCIAGAEGPHALRYFIRNGQRMPHHASASARAILAFMPGDEAERLIGNGPLERYTDSTPTTLAEVMEELSRVRQDGYAVCDHEIDPGVVALAAPIRDVRGQVVASLTVVSPENRMQPSRRALPVRLLIEASDSISRELGYEPAPSGPPVGANALA